MDTTPKVVGLEDIVWCSCMIAGLQFQDDESISSCSGLQVFLAALRRSASELIMMVVMLVVLVVIFSSLIYFAELENNNTFHDITGSFWWALVTMTSVGYGDVYPISNHGYLVGALCAVFSVVVASLPIPILATNFEVSDFKGISTYRWLALALQTESNVTGPIALSNYTIL